jgi:hypothetical protein
VLPEPDKDHEVIRQSVVAFLGVMEVHRIPLFLTEDLDMTLGHSVCAGSVRLGADVLGAKCLAGLGKATREVSGSVIRHHLAALHALIVEPGHRSGSGS